MFTKKRLGFNKETVKMMHHIERKICCRVSLLQYRKLKGGINCRLKKTAWRGR